MPLNTPDDWKKMLDTIGMTDFVRDTQVPGSIAEVMSDGNWEVIFHQFATSEFSAENVDFLRAVAVFESSGDLSQAEQIYHQFVAADAATQVNLSGAVRGDLDGIFGEGGVGHGPPSLFDGAKTEIGRMLGADTFRRFRDGVTGAQGALAADIDWDAVGTRERSGDE